MIEKMLLHIVPGLIYGIGALGLALTFRYLRFPDFTVLGSIMLGGVVCVYVTNHYNQVVGLLAGATIGALLGAITGFLVYRIRIPKVLAGIITFTASFSLGYFIATDGTIALQNPSFISPTFVIDDLLTTLLIAILLSSFLAFLMKTKFGSLLLAMNADDHFRKLRHRDRGKVFLITVSAGNAIVAFAGALYAFKDQAAYVVSHSDFLPYSLGAMFSGNAVISWASKKLSEHRKANSSPESNPSILSVVSTERDETSKIGILFFAYVLGCVFFKEISGLVYANAFKDFLLVPTNFQYFVIALLMTVFVWWASEGEEEL